MGIMGGKKYQKSEVYKIKIVVKTEIRNNPSPESQEKKKTTKKEQKKVHSHEKRIQVVTKPITEERTSKKTMANERAHNPCALADAA